MEQTLYEFSEGYCVKNFERLTTEMYVPNKAAVRLKP